MIMFNFIVVYIFSAFFLFLSCRYLIENNISIVTSRIEELLNSRGESIKDYAFNDININFAKVILLFSIPFIRWALAFGIFFIATLDEDRWKKVIELYKIT